VPKLNGQTGTVQSFVALRGSYYIKFEGGEVKQLKPECLCRWYPSGTKVLLRGLAHSAELNEHVAIVQGFDQERGRYLVNLNAKSKSGKTRERTSLLRPEHLHTLFPVGAIVKIFGLAIEWGAENLNGNFAKVEKKFDETRAEYVVRLFGSSKQSYFRPEVLSKAVPGEYNEEDAQVSGDAPGEASEDDDASSIASADLLEHLPAPASPVCSSSSSSSDSLGFKKKRSRPKFTPKTAIPRAVLKSMVEKTMKSVPIAERSTSSA
jgi:hypothetical protein